MIVTNAEIEALSPDQSSTKNAIGIFNKTAWEVYRSDRALWSAIKGSGSNPYLCAMDTVSLAFKCSCPSRKFPCKHGLALGFYLASHTLSSIQSGDEPLWVQEWIDKRTAKLSEPKAPTAPISKEKMEEKSLSKWDGLAGNIEYIELFLHDAIKGGILELSNKEEDFWQKHIKTMVDMKIIGLNRYFNTLASLDYAKEGWEERAIGVLRSLHLLCVATRNHTQLEDEFKNEIEQTLGWSKTKQELLGDPNAKKVEDKWVVLAIIYETKENLTSRKVYLYGVEQKGWGYILDFSYNGVFGDLYLQGDIFRAKIIFFGKFQPRAIIATMGAKDTLTQILPPLANLEDGERQFILNQNRFLLSDEDLMFVGNLTLVWGGKHPLLVDKEGRYIPLDTLDESSYLHLLLITRSEWFDGFLLKSEGGYRLLALAYNQRIVTL